MQKIVVILGKDSVWAEEAVHQACGLARITGSELMLVQVIPVQHFSHINTSFGNMNFTPAQAQMLERYQDTAEDYGITTSTLLYQYYALAEAIGEIAQYKDAQVVFATLPKSLWRNWQLRRLERRLQNHNCQLYTLDKPVPKVALSPTAQPLIVTLGK